MSFAVLCCFSVKWARDLYSTVCSSQSVLRPVCGCICSETLNTMYCESVFIHSDFTAADWLEDSLQWHLTEMSYQLGSSYRGHDMFSNLRTKLLHPSSGAQGLHCKTEYIIISRLQAHSHLNNSSQRSWKNFQLE